MEKIVSLAKRRGFIFPGSEIYGGLAGTWDYGPLGVELKNNIKKEWWRANVQNRDDIVGLDAAIMMQAKVWEASGHTEAFTDPLVECKKCHSRFRLDEIKSSCSKCGASDFTNPEKFNLLVEAYLGVLEGKKQKIYLRGEITQGVHVNFKNVLDATARKIPFGIAQIGKAFRNEITPGNFIFRSREFEQMEIQYYVKPEMKESMKWFNYWKKERMKWYLDLGIKKNNLKFRQHEKDERAHYATDACDIEYKSPFGWKEFEGIHHRADWDLSRHQKFSGKDLSYFDSETNKKYLPWVIETSGGIDRATLFFLIDAYREEKMSARGGSALGGKNDIRIILKLHPQLAPYKVAVFPLLANKPKLVKAARAIYTDLKPYFMTYWDDRGNIGKRYRAQDEIGTPFCLTVDFESLDKKDVTVRDRDTMKQKRIKIKDLNNYFQSLL